MLFLAFSTTICLISTSWWCGKRKLEIDISNYLFWDGTGDAPTHTVRIITSSDMHLTSIKHLEDALVAEKERREMSDDQEHDFRLEQKWCEITIW